MMWKNFFSVFVILMFTLFLVNTVFAQAPPPPPPPSQSPTISGIPNQTFEEDSGLNDNIIDLFDDYASDPEDSNTQLTFSIISQSNASIVSCSVDSDRYIDCTTQSNQFGSSDVTVRVTNRYGATDTDTFRVTVTAVEDVPVATDDSYTTTEDTVLTVNATNGVLANDNDPDGDTLTVTLVTDVSSGTLTLNTDGSFTYTPNANFFSTDTFTYTVNDGTDDSNTATVTITVTAVNDAPTASDNNVTTNEDTPYTFTVSDFGFSDVDTGDTLQSVQITTLETVGALQLSGVNVTLNQVITEADITAGNLIFVSVANEFEVNYDNFQFTVNDGTDDSVTPNTMTIDVTAVNDVPVATDDSYTTNEDTILTVNATNGVLANDNDSVEGSPLTTVLVSDVSSGTLTLNTNGSFTYVPNADFNGTDSFTYTANDGTDDSNIATATINVNAINDAPVANAQSITVDEDGSVAITLTGSDVDGDTLNYTVTTNTTSGTLSGTAPSLTYTPNPDFNGLDSFTFIVNDGTVDSSPAIVSITINSVNDVPVATDDSYTTNEDTILTVDTASGVLANDNDSVEGSPLTTVLVSDVSSGTLTLNTNGSFTYTPNANYNGPDSFTYQANDGTDNSNTATVTITVNAVNDAPVFSIIPNQGVINGTDLVDNLVDLHLFASDAEDTDPSTLIYTLVSQSNTSVIDCSLDSNQFINCSAPLQTGFSDITVQVNDTAIPSLIDTITFTITVTSVPVANDQTVTTDEDTPIDITLTGSDVDGDTLNYTVTTNTTSGTLSGTAPDLTYTPNANFFGPDSFTFVVNDGTFDSNPATISITVTSVSDAPTASDNNVTTNEDTPYTFTVSDFGFSDVDIGDTLQSVQITTLETVGALQLSGVDVTLDQVITEADITAGNLIFAPVTEQNGAPYDTFQFTVNDGTTDSATPNTMTIDVTAVNDAPTATDDSYNVDEDNTLTENAATGVLANDNDVEGDPLTAVLVTDVSSGNLTLNTDGSFTYTPNANFFGTDSFTYTANDGTDDSNTATVTITVTAVNDAPVATDDSYNTNEDTVLTLDAATGVLANDNDVEGDPLTAVLVSDVSSGTLTLNTDGSFTYTPNADFNGQDTFTYTANDGTDNSNTATVTITVGSANDAPVATDDSYVSDEDTILTVDTASGVLANDNDPDGDTLTVTLVTDVSSGTLTLNTDGSFTYTPNANFFGTDSFTYTANDGTDDSNEATVTITVTAVNDAPVATDDSYVTDEDTILTVDTASGVLANDNDPDGDTLTITLVTDVSSGNLTLNTDGSFTYAPNGDFNGQDTFTYTVNDGTVDSSVATVTINVGQVNDNPTVQILQPQGTFVEGENVLVDATASDADGDALTFTLDFGDGITAAGNVIGGQITTTHVYNTPGAYVLTITVTDAQGLTATDTVQVAVLSYSVSIVADKTSGIEPLTVNFDAVSNGGNDPLTYAWDFNNDGFIDSTLKNPTVVFDEDGKYLVRLTVIDADGDKATTTVQIKIDDAPSKLPRRKIHIGQIRFLEEAQAGEYLEVLVSLENTDSIKTRELSATVVIPELGLRKKVGNEKLKAGETTTKTIIIPIPSDTEPGIYDVMITINDHDTNRRRYRQIKII